MTPHLPPVPGHVAEAFQRPEGSVESLERPSDTLEEITWEPPSDPWRRPDSRATLGEPAGAAHRRDAGDKSTESSARARSALAVERLNLRALWALRRVTWPAAILLMVAVVAIAVLGAAVGAMTGSAALFGGGSTVVTFSTASPDAADRPGSVATIAARVLPSVVAIEVRSAVGGDSGSGIVIDDSGDVLTNNHVVANVADGDSLSVLFDDDDRTRVPARVVGRDPLSDLAVIKVDSVRGLARATLGDSDTLVVGDAVIAVGSPLGLMGTVTTGVVSALHRPVNLAGSGPDGAAVIDAIQTDAAINPGNSGGPLVGPNGGVVGVSTAIRTLSNDPRAGGSIGLGFAIPINRARAIAQELIETGTVVHATLGVHVRSITAGSRAGAQVRAVDPGGPAAAAGIREQDVITRIADREVRSAGELVVAVRSHEVGDRVGITVMRGGREMTVTATLGAL